MKYQWINKYNNKKLIIFFNGWGMNSNSISHLKFEDYDILMYYDYSDINFEEPILDNYSYIVLISYSLGILSSMYFLNNSKILPDIKIAINGSGIPISDEYGIPVELYFDIMNNLNDTKYKKFLFSICGNISNYRKFLLNHQYDIDSLKKELVSIKDLQNDINSYSHGIWNTIILCSEDEIFPLQKKKRPRGLSPPRCLSLVPLVVSVRSQPAAAA
jgi:biotin synthesis protein BioG